MLKLDRVSKFYSTNGVVTSGFSKVSLDFQLGEFVAITGESGSGKSTLLNVISGLDSYEEGEMYIYGQPTSGYGSEDMEDYRKRYIGNIFQTFNLVNHYTVYQNVELVLLLAGYDAAEAKERVDDIIHKVGLDDYRNTKASKLSGGQKQRVAIARALAKETPIIVADEPTGNLDVASAADIIKLLASLSQDKLIIIVTHNYEQVEPYVTRKISMHDGKVVEDKQVKQSDGKVSSAPAKIAKHDGLSTQNTARLGVRNAFSLLAKFLLLLAVFTFLSIGTFASYSTYTGMKTEPGYNSWGFIFSETNIRRLVVTKENGDAFTPRELETVRSIENVAYLEPNDFLVDQSFTLTNLPIDILYSEEEEFDAIEVEFWLDVNTGSFEAFGDREIVRGRLPENEEEALILIEKDGWLDEYQIEDIDGETVYLQCSSADLPADGITVPIEIVGYAYITDKELQGYYDSSLYHDGTLILTKEGQERLETVAMVSTAITEVKAGDSVLTVGPSLITNDVWLYADPSLEQGTVRVPDYVAYTAALSAKEIGRDAITFRTRGKSYDRKGAFKIVETIPGETRIYINPEDLWSFYAPPEQKQITAMMESGYYANETIAALEAEGFKAIYPKETANKENPIYLALLGAMRVVVLALLLGVLFFVTYFILKLIMKSQNVYYSTVRMLGGSQKACSGTLLAELLVIFHLAFGICVAIMVKITLAGSTILPEYMVRLVRYIQPLDYVLLYGVVLVMTILLSYRYSGQMFRKTAMNAYREEV